MNAPAVKMLLLFYVPDLVFLPPSDSDFIITEDAMDDVITEDDMYIFTETST